MGTEPQMFWADAPWVVEASEEHYGPKTLYGPFYSGEVAHAWATDMKFASAKLRRMEPPPDHTERPTWTSVI